MDAGRIEIEGEAVELKSPLDAREIGIAFVHQEMALLPTMSIADNMYISGFPKKSGLIDYTAMESRCAEVLGTLGCAIPPRTKIQNLGAGDRQMVEIARALLSAPDHHLRRADLLAFERGKNEALQRDPLASAGRIGDHLHHPLSRRDILSLRQGSGAQERGGDGRREDRGPRLRAGREAHAWRYGPRIIKKAHGEGSTGRGCVPAGDRLGTEGLFRGREPPNPFWRGRRPRGLLGSGRSELARALTGLDPVDGGTIEVRVRGGLRKIRSSGAKKWIGMITENRREAGS